ncbi:MAG: hypothetical protein ABIP48_17010 [Planctomycetota bacterium]
MGGFRVPQFFPHVGGGCGGRVWIGGGSKMPVLGGSVPMFGFRAG